MVGLGCWQLGADWGEVDEQDALGVLAAAADAGVTFFDTADVYGDGRSERMIRAYWESGAAVPGITVATKAGRRADPFTPAEYTEANLRSWIDRSRRNLGVETLDLVQLHCPPTPIYSDDRVFAVLDALVDEKAIAAYGVSVETVQEALTAIARPGVATVQIILNVFRLKPLGRVLPAAAETGVGIIARVPLASGLLSGRYDEHTAFAANDHRNFNRHGESFDVGETFSGVPYEVGLDAVRELRGIAPAEWTTAQLALRWIIDQPQVSTVIPGARNPAQASANAAAGELPPLPSEAHAAVAEVYDRLIRPHVHDRW